MNPCQAFFTELRAFSNGLENDCRELVAMAKQKPSYESSVQGYRGFGFIDHLASLTGEIDANLRVMRSVSDDSNRMLHLDSIMEVCAAILKENEKLIDRVENKLEAYGYQRPKKTRMALYSEALDGQAQQNLGMANVMGGLRSNNNNNLNTSDEMMSGLDDSFDNGNHHNSSAYGVAPMSPATPDIVQAKRDIRHDQYSKPLFQSATSVAPRTPTLDDYGISASALALINQGPPSPIEGGTATAGGQFHTNRWAEPVEMDFDTPHKNRYQPHQGTAFSAVTPGTYRRFVDESQVAAAAMANINAAGDQAQGAAMLQGRPPSMSFQPIAFPDLNDAQFQHNSQQQQQQPQLVQPQQHRFSIFPTTATAFNAFPSQQQQMQQQQQYHHHQQQEQQQHQMQQFQQLQQQQHQQQQQQFQPFQQVFLQQQHQQPVTPFQQQVATGVAPSSGTTTGMFTGPSPAVAASFPNAASNVNTTSTTPIPPTPSSVSPFTVPAVNATPFPSATMTSSRGDGTRSSTPLPVVDGGAFSGAVPSICNSNININNNANINDNNNNNNVNDAATTATTITNTNNNNNNSLDRSDIQDNLYPLMEPVSAEEFEAVPLFLKSQFTLQFVNETISAINDFMTDKRFGDGSNFLTQEELRDELALGTKTKAVILLLVRLNRFSSQKRLAGEETVYFLRGAH